MTTCFFEQNNECESFPVAIRQRKMTAGKVKTPQVHFGVRNYFAAFNQFIQNYLKGVVVSPFKTLFKFDPSHYLIICTLSHYLYLCMF